MVMEVQAPPNGSLLAPFSASFSTPFLEPFQNYFLSLPSRPGEPTSARIDSSGALFENLEPNSKKGGHQNGPPFRPKSESLVRYLLPFRGLVFGLVF